MIYKINFFHPTSIPIFIISYVRGWKIGFLTAAIPIIYGLFFRNMDFLSWDILLGLLLPFFIGSIFCYLYHNQETKEDFLVQISVKKVLLSFLPVLIFNLVIAYWRGTNPTLWLNSSIIYSLFSLLTLYFCIALINEHHRILQELFENRRELEHSRKINRKFLQSLSRLITPSPVKTKAAASAYPLLNY